MSEAVSGLSATAAAARALGRLGDAGLVVRHEARHRADGTFGPIGYELVVGHLEGAAPSGDPAAGGPSTSWWE